jgi:hypothetical protein
MARAAAARAILWSTIDDPSGRQVRQRILALLILMSDVAKALAVKPLRPFWCSVILFVLAGN